MLFRYFVLLFYFASYVEAQELPATTLIEKANISYQASNYPDAIKYYQQVLDQGLENADLLFNLGNCYFRNLQLGYAIYYYRKALNISPEDKDIRENLILSRKQVNGILNYNPDKEFKTRLLNSLIFIKKTNKEKLKYYIVISAILLSLTLILKLLLNKKNIFKAVYLLIIIYCYLLLLFCFSVQDKNGNLTFHFSSYRQGIIIAKDAKVYSGDSTNYQVISVLPEGVEVYVNQERNSWVELILPNDRKGWIEESNIGIL